MNYRDIFLKNLLMDKTSKQIKFICNNGETTYPEIIFKNINSPFFNALFSDNWSKKNNVDIINIDLNYQCVDNAVKILFDAPITHYNQIKIHMNNIIHIIKIYDMWGLENIINQIIPLIIQNKNETIRLTDICNIIYQIEVLCINIDTQPFINKIKSLYNSLIINSLNDSFVNNILKLPKKYYIQILGSSCHQTVPINNNIIKKIKELSDIILKLYHDKCFYCLDILCDINNELY